MPQSLTRSAHDAKCLTPERLDEDRAWRAVMARDSRFDGRVYYAVRTTGIYCRPSCPARKPDREHVSFHASPEAAERAGFRPCKRCAPSGVVPAWAERIERACRLMGSADAPVTLADLARAVGSSPHHFHRQFKASLGITPKAYAEALRDQRVRAALSRGATVTEALYEAGFSSSGRFYSGASGALGMAPRTFRDGGTAEQLTYAVAPCSLGYVLIAASTKGVCAILLGDQPDELTTALQTLFPHAVFHEGDGRFGATAAAVVSLVDMPAKQSALPLDIRGTAFQRRVWEALRKIPPGKTATYGEIAATIGAPKAVRAVAGACAANKLAVAIPCHRVVRRDGTLSGYRWGPGRKRTLLDREKG
ncbi:6-O-methylguanine DNA methyltransferase [Methyloceanibacter methanicus]|uniref:methylated-DNA--[protein]-cysteine S-methyltransferase n=1 Tax=Methyloceanibacter methanicus TaxID=1774968 RepID=A0A1E3W2P6_9HYPH|nr:bifunctional DNA-binding transcriptional regulator/O6-methylguanine-DNA methyltransferase Ada [Methyloceanibacter methanicus]ODS00034.1 6-O-methylguanine DNA methyltransferase [Methyloceanibacter methanicus]